MSTGSTSETTVDLGKVIIGPLDPRIDRAVFCCGNQKIDNFFRINAKDQHEKHKVRVYVGLYGGVVVGYYYLVATSMSPDTISAEALEKFGRVNITPCVYLGMIGVHRGFQGNGVGNLLMVHAMQKTLEVANLVGIYALTLDAVDEKTAATYEMGIPKIYRA